MIEEVQIKEKSIYIVEQHNYALLAWDKIKSSLSEKPYLITIDYHTDTKEAFKVESFIKAESDSTKASKIQSDLTEKFIKEDSCIKEMISLLKNDEHIDAAIKKSIISHAFSINNMDSTGTLSKEENEHNMQSNDSLEERLFGNKSKPKKPFGYVIPSNRIFHVPHQNVLENSVNVYDIVYFAIDDCLIRTQVQNIEQMSETSGLGKLNELPFILDIDLDYFNTVQSINPVNKSVFYDLIKKSSAITIAKESDCVLENRIDNEITSDYLLPLLLSHIKEALN